MEIQTFKKMEKNAIKNSGIDFIRLGFGLLFMIAVLSYSFMTSGGIPNNVFLAVAALFGAYMAMNIGANDVANNVGPAVGSKALTMGGAIVIAAIFEAGGALIAGGDVVKTIKKGIIDITAFSDASVAVAGVTGVDIFIWAMMAALLSAALWLNIATYFKAPVSTTHSVVGGVMGAGIAAFGFSIVQWGTMGKIAMSWVISPVLGGIIAAIFLFSIKKTMVFKEDKIKASKAWVPVFVAIMSWAFVTYLVLKGLKKVWPHLVEIFAFLPDTKKPTFAVAALLGLAVAVIVFFIIKVRIAQVAPNIENSRDGVNSLFTFPLIFAAALLSFAHGANDVANAVGPLAAINDAVISGGISSKAGIPLWVMAVGALGIAIGLALYGPKLIRTVGGEITELDQMRAFSVAMAAAITVIIASQLGLPVSSTHIAIGGIFGVGFLREYLEGAKDGKAIDIIAQDEKIIKDERKLLKAYESELETLEEKAGKGKEDYKRIVDLYKFIDEEKDKIKTAKKEIKSVQKVQYVKRDTIKKIVSAWVITVPIAGVLSAMVFYMIKGIVL
ncbi:MAG: inorganic phosphate transporter [Moraxellaceae bacterium]|nr:inorganic phosphate transporter [Moraxellaceae bacterium]